MTPLRLALLAVAIGAVGVGAFLLRPGQRGPAAAAQAGAPSPSAADSGRVSPGRPGSVTGTSTAPAPQAVAPVAATPRAPPSAAEKGDEAIARAMNMQHPSSTPLLDELARYSQQELELRARISRKTGGEPPPAVDRLFALSRGGAGKEELMAFADRELASPMSLRVTAREWIENLR